MGQYLCVLFLMCPITFIQCAAKTINYQNTTIIRLYLVYILVLSEWVSYRNEKTPSLRAEKKTQSNGQE